MVLTVALAALIGGLSAPSAKADEYDHGRNDQHEGGYHEQRQAQPRYEQRRYIYAPPPVYYAAPARRPVIDLIFPFEFR